MTQNYYIKESVLTNIRDSVEVQFDCGKNMMNKWKAELDFAKDKLEFEEKEKSVKLKVFDGKYI